MTTLSPAFAANHKSGVIVAVAAVLCCSLSLGMAGLFAEYAPHLQAQAPAAADPSS